MYDPLYDPMKSSDIYDEFRKKTEQLKAAQDNIQKLDMENQLLQERNERLIELLTKVEERYLAIKRAWEDEKDG